jgi:D-alanine-D-alanine ligase
VVSRDQRNARPWASGAICALVAVRILAGSRTDRGGAGQRHYERYGHGVVVKAANLGYSVGVSKVKSKDDFEKAVNDSFNFDDCVLFEEFIEGREIECAILGNDPVQASLPGEIIISSKYDFYTFDAKYVDGTAVSIDVPANIEASLVEKIRTVSIKSYQALGCEDFSRVDLFLTKAGDVFVNEINTIPGFTNSSMFPMMWKERGISFSELITKLAELADVRYKKSKRVARDYQSALNF